MKTNIPRAFILSTCVIAIAAAFLANQAQAVTFAVSPSTVSNTDLSNVTLNIGGLTNGETVVVQRFADVNTNGVIDVADWLIQQYRLTDGYANMVGGVTNINIPHDVTPADGAITSPQSLLTAGIAPRFVGRYLYKLSSPTSRFPPITNLFTITNFTFSQSFSGSVRSSGTNVPYAGVLVFTPDPRGERLGQPIAGTFANAAGLYSIQVPPGPYLVWAFQRGYVADLSTSPVLTLNAGGTISTNLNLVPGTRTISGRVVDAANNAIGLPGILSAWNSSAGQLGVHFTDTNGYFNCAVTSGDWRFGGDGAPFAVLGYLEYEDWPGVSTTTGSVAGVTLAVPKATAVYYGSVKDNLGNPLVGIDIDAGGNVFESAAQTDANGNYVTGVLGDGTYWWVEVSNDVNSRDGRPTMYVFSQANSSAMTSGQAIRRDFTGLLATNHLSGHVSFNGNPVGGVYVWAFAIINGLNYQTDTHTDPNGDYSLNVANGNWTVGLACSDDDDSLDSILGQGNYQCPANQTVTIVNNNGVAQFPVQPPEPLHITTTTLPDGTVDSFYSEQLAAAGGQPAYHWYLPGGTASLPPGTMNLSDDGILSGIPTTAGTYDFWVGVWDSTWSVVVTQQITLTISAPTADVQSYYVTKTKAFLQWDAAAVGLDTNGWPFIATVGIIQSSLGAVPIANVTFPTSTVKALPAGSSALELRLREFFPNEAAFDAAYPVGNYTFTLFGVHDGLQSPVLTLPASSYPNAPRVSNFGPAQSVNPAQSFLLQWDAFSGAGANDNIWVVITDAGGQPVFSTPNPSADHESALSGTATSVTIPAGTLQFDRTYQGRIIFFKVLGVDTTQYPGAVGVTMATTLTTFPLATLSSAPRLSLPAKPSVSEFRFLVQGIAGQNYTIEGSSNLVHWNLIRITNAPADVFPVLLNRATNSHGFFRVKLGP